MEWPYSPIEEESLYNFISSPQLEMTNKSLEWTYDENKLFENLLAELNPGSADFFEQVASKLPWKTMQQIKNHYQALVDDVEMIESGNFPVPDYNDNNNNNNSNNNFVDEKEKENDVAEKNEGSPSEVGKTRNNGGQRRRGVPWTEEEHQLFLMGLNKYGKGDWRSISRYYVITKTPTQVASHAQKYFRRQTSSTPIDRRRPSIHDIQTVNPPTTFTPSFPQINHANNLNVLNQGFNGGIVQQNPNFNLATMNPNFPSTEDSMFNQSASRDFTTSFLFSSQRNQHWG